MFEEYFKEIRGKTENLIKENISKDSVEFKKENLPDSRGIYFIYKKIKDGIREVPVYVGCAYKKSDKNDRSIKSRCSQNLGPRNTGGTFRDRVMKEVLKLEPYEYIEDENGKRKKGGIIEENTKQGIEYISKNFVLKFIEVSENTSENEVLLIERACINYYNPIYNKA